MIERKPKSASNISNESNEDDIQDIETIATIRSRVVSFHGDEILAVQASDSSIYVPLRRLCSNLGLSRVGQVQRIKRNDVLTEGLKVVVIESETNKEQLSLRADLIPMWLSTVSTTRIKDEKTRSLMVLYQRECAKVLWREFASSLPSEMQPSEMQGNLLEQPPTTALTTTEAAPIATISEEEELSGFGADISSIETLRRLHENTLAIAKLYEAQIEMQERLSKAAKVVGGILKKIDNHEARIAKLEVRLDPAEYITQEQAAEVSLKVKALAEELNRRFAEGGVHYNQVFQELYRRFSTASYKQIRLEQYESVMAFLDDWKKSLDASEQKS